MQQGISLMSSDQKPLVVMMDKIEYYIKIPVLYNQS